MQGAGRAARQENPGQYIIIVPPNDELLIDAARDLKQKISPSSLIEHRDKLVAKMTEKRIINSKIELVSHKYLEKFIAWYKDRSKLASFNKNQILNSWAKFYSSIEDIEHPIKKYNEYDERFESMLAKYSQHVDSLFNIWVVDISNK